MQEWVNIHKSINFKIFTLKETIKNMRRPSIVCRKVFGIQVPNKRFNDRLDKELPQSIRKILAIEKNE
jgi:hypothetical protein